MTFAMLGLLLSSNQIVLAQIKNQDLLKEIDNFFNSLSGVSVYCGVRLPTNMHNNDAIASYSNLKYLQAEGAGVMAMLGKAKECRVFLDDKANAKMSEQEKSVLMKINDFFMSLQKQGKVTLVSQVGTQIPGGDPVAHYNNSSYVKGSTSIGSAREEVLVFAKP